jgi:hypothetical protein
MGHECRSVRLVRDRSSSMWESQRKHARLRHRLRSFTATLAGRLPDVDLGVPLPKPYLYANPERPPLQRPVGRSRRNGGRYGCRFPLPVRPPNGA